MAEAKLDRVTGAHPKRVPSSLEDFAEYIEKQLNSMEQSGWVGREAVQLRRWAAELRGKSLNDFAGSRFAYRLGR